MNLQPHKTRYWLHSTEKSENPAVFAQKVNEICELYQAANELGTQDTHVVSTDEMTGIQVLEHKYPDKLPLPGSTAKMEFEYIRHGTTSLIGFFDIVGGFLYAPYLNKTRTEEDFCHALEEVASTDPKGTWVFICDGLNIHKSETLVRFITQSCGLEDELGKKGNSGILKSKASREAFLHDPFHRIRLVYTPKHSSWMNQIEIWFGIINRKPLRRKSYLSVEELEGSIRKFISQYNLTAHPFKWT